MLIKICGIKRAVDYNFLIDAGVDICGFIFHKGSPRFITPKDAATLNKGMRILRAGVFVNHSAKEIIEISKIASLDFIQLHGEYSPNEVKILNHLAIIKVIWPERFNSLDEIYDYAKEWKDLCAYFLLDSGKSGGGSGKNIQWDKYACLKLPREWFLAGGLNPDNIEDALENCRPAGVDINSGVETEAGVKSRDKIEKAILKIRKKI